MSLRARERNVLKTTSVAIICLFATVSFFSLYSKLFQGTIWGYPENLFDSIITLTLLKYLTYFGFVLIPIFAILVIVFRPSQFDKEANKQSSRSHSGISVQIIQRRLR
jgi:hypothetical protein